MARPVNAAEVIDRLTVIGQLEPERDVGTVLSYLVGTTLVERTHELEGVNQRIEHAKARHGSACLVDHAHEHGPLNGLREQRRRVAQDERGMKINTRGQVISSDGEPISGLYAAGELVGGIFWFNYPGGSGLTNGSVFGRIAGTNAANRQHE
jgi:predicted oxidoreductase